MKNVLISGGSSGIGFELSKQFAKNGYAVYWVSLIQEELEQAKTQILTQFPDLTLEFLVLDLSKPQAVQTCFEWIKEKDIKIDVLVNNAGFATFGLSPTISMEREITMIELNVLSLYKMTRLFLEDMQARNQGTIINISSNTSFQPVPRMAAYGATKSFVANYSRALQEELVEMKSNVKVMTVCPAAIKDTRFKATANMENVKTFEGLLVTTKEEVAKDIWRGFNTGKDYLLTGARLRRLYPIIKILPQFIVNFLMKQELSEK